MGSQVQDAKGNVVSASSVDRDVQFYNVGNRLAGLAIIAFHRDRRLQSGSFNIKKFGNIDRTYSINKSETIYSSVSKGSYINSISISRYSIWNRKVFSTY